MDRFRLKENQMNPANHVECLRFLKIYDEDNLADFKNYMKYLIGVRKIGMTSVQARYYCILQFLLYCEEKGVSADKIGSVHIEQYLKMLYDRENNQGTFNQAVKILYAFFEYLVIKGKLQVVPFRREFFEMRTIHKHHFGYVDENGEYQGYDVYFGNRIAKDLGVKVKYVPVEAAARVEVLATGKVDLVLANFTVTPERAEKVDFALPYMKVALGIVSPKSALVTDPAQLNGKTLIIANHFMVTFYLFYIIEKLL